MLGRTRGEFRFARWLLALGLALVCTTRGLCEDEMAKTIAKGIANREASLREIDMEFLYEMFERESPDLDSRDDTGGDGEGIVFSPNGTHSLYWVRVAAEEGRARIETCVLKPGPTPGGIAAGVGPRQSVRMGVGREVASDYVRSTIVLDGSRKLYWENVMCVLMVTPQQWVGLPVTCPDLMERMMFGVSGQTFGERLAGILSGAGAQVSVSKAGIGEQQEFWVTAELRSNTIQGAFRHQYKVCVAPGLGYAVKWYEEMHSGPAGHAGNVGTVMVGTDFVRAGAEVWIPREVVRAQFDYAGAPGDTWRSTYRTRVTSCAVNERLPDRFFCFDIPVATTVQDETGSIPTELVKGRDGRAAVEVMRSAEGHGPPVVEPRLNPAG